MMCGTKLQHLNISWNFNLTGQGLDRLQGKFSDLKKLNLEYCWVFPDEELLKELRMCGTMFSALTTMNLEYRVIGLDQGFQVQMKVVGSNISTNVKNKVK